MADDRNEADVFAVPDFRQASKRLERLEQQTPLFSAGKPAGSRRAANADAGRVAFLDAPTPGLISLASVDPASEGFFKLPPLAADGPREPRPEPGPEPADASSDGAGRDELEDDDAWMEDVGPDTQFGVRSWETFDAGSAASRQPMLLSEAGAGAYDALLSGAADPLRLDNSDIPAVQTGAYFSSLLALALGRDSIFFIKDEGSSTFKPALPKLRLSGYSRQVLQGVEGQAHWCGSTFLQLKAFVVSAYDTLSSRCGVALASSVTQVLQAVEQRVAVDGGRPGSVLQLQATIKEVLTILKYLRRLTSKLGPNCADQEILSLVYHTASSVDDGENYIRYIFREILGRVSSPWVETMEEWVGTRREAGMPLTKANLGEARGFVRVEAEAYVDDFGREQIDVDFRLDCSKVPDFMPRDIVETIFETGRNLRFIRSFHPGHMLAQESLVQLTQPPKAEWHYDWGSILDLEVRVRHYRESLQEALERSRRDGPALPPSEERQTAPRASAFAFDCFGLDEVAMEERITASISQLNQPLNGAGHEDSLGRIVHDGLSGLYQPVPAHSDATPHWSLLPVLSFGGIASAQAHIINREALRLLFDEHDVRGHLSLQREFHLLGNGLFCSRLSHALFDPDLESAERQVGVARRGGLMGLRLGGRETWPPASSELRLALMGVLAESYGSRGGAARGAVSYGEVSGLPGGLSFAVRDLSEEEIDKCINADSLEALDFLRLAYKAPPQLACIITPANLAHYDRIFKLLLRILRMLHVVCQLHRDVHARDSAWARPGDVALRFTREAQRLVTSVASYLLDTGVAVPWRDFEQRLDQVRADLDSGPAKAGGAKLESPTQLRELHAQVLDRIMSALLLRKRQQPVLGLLEGVFATVLAYAKWSRLQALGRGGEAGGDDEAARLYAQFRKQTQVFMTVCRGLSEKGGGAAGGRAAGAAGLGEESLVSQLLLKLDMGEHYIRG